MASLVEELVNILEAEQKVYETLTGYEEKKKDVLIRADVPALEEITNLEQLAGDELIAYSNKQVQALTDIATVLGKTEEKMTVTRLIDLLDTQAVLAQLAAAVNPDLLDIWEASDLERIVRTVLTVALPLIYDAVHTETAESREELSKTLEILRRGMGAKPAAGHR